MLYAHLAGNVLVQKKTSGETEIVLLDHGLYTQLSNKFRYDYADFWLAIINKDVEAIKATADNLGVGKDLIDITGGSIVMYCNAGSLYGLFACMVTARSWSSIQKGLDVAPKTKSEVDLSFYPHRGLEAWRLGGLVLST